MEFCADFKYDLKIGQEGENKLATILSSNTVEVKRDSWTYRSGNIAIEFESRGKPSGIRTSKADWWCFILSGGYKDQIIVLVSTKKLKQLFSKYFLMGYIKQMGDNNTSNSVLIPIKEIFNNETEINNEDY